MGTKSVSEPDADGTLKEIYTLSGNNERMVSNYIFNFNFNSDVKFIKISHKIMKNQTDNKKCIPPPYIL